MGDGFQRFPYTIMQQLTRGYNIAMIKCPYCDEDIQSGAAKCKHCGEWLRDAAPRVGTFAQSEVGTPWLEIILALIFPLIGIIIWLVYGSTNKKEQAASVRTATLISILLHLLLRLAVRNA